MKLSDFMIENKESKRIRKLFEHNSTLRQFKQFDRVNCHSGLSMSIQANYTAYCSPRGTLPIDEYWEVEIGFPNQVVPELLAYAEEPEKPTETVYPYVPVELVKKIIEKHGGVKIYNEH